MPVYEQLQTMSSDVIKKQRMLYNLHNIEFLFNIFNLSTLLTHSHTQTHSLTSHGAHDWAELLHELVLEGPDLGVL